MPLVMDEDGIVWVAAKDQGGVESITFNHISHGLQKSGILVQSGRLNERLVARAVEIVVIGSGLGACRILSPTVKSLATVKLLPTIVNQY